MDPLTIAGVIVVVVVSITTHEASHGFVADRLGDPTARRAGRLTLNPIPHIDLFFTILLPFLLILGVAFFAPEDVPPLAFRATREALDKWRATLLR